jgi:hypothetical protein
VSRAAGTLLLICLCGTAGCSLDFGRFKYSAKRDAEVAGGSHADAGASHNDGGGGEGGVCDSGLARNSDGSCLQSSADGGATDGGGGGDTGRGDGGNRGGDGGPGGDAGGHPAANAAPTVEVSFPRPGLTDLAAITVRGKVTDSDGDAIAELRVNDVLATVSADGRFNVSAPLALGRNALHVHVQDARGATADIDSVEVERMPYLFRHAADMVLDGAHQRLIAVDDATDAVVAISTVDGSREVIAQPSTTPVGRNSVELDAANNRLLVTERDAGALAWIDLSTGARTLVSDAARGTGDTFVPSAAVLVSAMPDRAFVLVESSSSASSMHVYSVELSTGNRTPLSAATGADLVYDQGRNRLVVVGSNYVQAVNLSNGNATTLATVNGTVPAVGRGSLLFNPVHSIVDGDRLLVAGGDDFGDGRACIHSLDLLSGNHHEVAALTLGSDPLPLSPSDTGFPFAYDPATGSGWGLDPLGRLLSVRLHPGDREYFSTLLYANGPAFADPAALADDATRSRWLVADWALGAIGVVDKKTGDRRVLSDAATGTGPAFGSLTLASVAVDTVHDSVIALDSHTLYAIDPVSGNRTVVSSDSTTNPAGTGAGFSNSTGVAVSPDGTQAMVVGCYGPPYPCTGQIVAIDLVTDTTHTIGKRTLFASSSVGTGPIEALKGIIVNPSGTIPARYLVIGAASLLAVDASGNRTVIADVSTGSGATLTNLKALAYDRYEDRIVVSNDGGGSLLAVDVLTGNRTLLTDPTANAGPSQNASALIADPPTHTLLIAEGLGGNDGGLVAIQLCDRKRDLISDQSRGIWNAFATVLDPSTGGLYAGQLALDLNDKTRGARVLALDTRTGQQTIVSDDADNGGSLRWQVPIALALDPFAHRLLGLNLLFCFRTCTNYGPNSLLSIDLADGAQSVMSDASKGGGLSWQTPSGVAWDQAHHRALLIISGLPGVVAVDPSNGDRTLFSGGPNGSGDAFASPGSGALDANHNRLLVVDSSALVAVDLDNGNRTPFSGTKAGSGPALIAPGRIVFDPVGDRAVVFDSGDMNNGPALISVAGSDGARSKLTAIPQRWYQSNSLLGFGFAFDGSSEIVYVSSSGLLALDPGSGDYLLMAGFGN